MSQIISFVQTKGGTGKTNLARCIAFSKDFQKKYSSVCLVDMDEQGSLKSWWSERESSGFKSDPVSFLHMVSSDIKLIQKQLENLTSNFELIILDVPGESVGRLYTQLACAISDLVLIPMRTSTDDESAFESNLVPIIREIIKSNPDQKSAFHVVPTFVHPRSRPEKYQEYFSYVLPQFISCFPFPLPYRSIFENYSRDGSTLDEYLKSVKNNARDAKQAKSAIADIKRLSINILKHLND